MAARADIEAKLTVRGIGAGWGWVGGGQAEDETYGGVAIVSVLSLL